MKFVFITILLLFSNISFGVTNFMNQNNGNIIYYCSNKIGQPWLENSSYDCWSHFMTAVLGTLIYVDNNGDLVPSMVESFNWDFEKNYYKLKLRENLVFHNERKVTIEDLEFSILRSFFAKNPNNEGALALYNLKGVEKIKHGQPYKSGLVEGVKILDKNTLALVPNTYNPSFLYNLSRAHYSLVPYEEYNDDLMTWKKWPVGAGAYKLIEEDKKNRSYQLVLVDNKNYPRAPKSIYFEQERILEPDITLKDSLSYKNSKYNKEVLSFPYMQRNINFNFSSPLGRNKDFRKAVSLAIFRDEIVKATEIETKPLNEMITTSSLGRINVLENYNLKEASRLFAKVLENQNTKVFKIPYSSDESLFGVKYREVIVNQLSKAGLQIEFYEGKNLWEPYTNEFQNSPFSLDSLMSDAFDFISTFTGYAKSGGASSSVYYYETETLENLIQIAKISNNRETLNERLKNLSKYFHENVIMVPLFETNAVVIYKPDKIESLGKQFGESIFYLHNIKMRDE